MEVDCDTENWIDAAQDRDAAQGKAIVNLKGP